MSKVAVTVILALLLSSFVNADRAVSFKLTLDFDIDERVQGTPEGLFLRV